MELSILTILWIISGLTALVVVFAPRWGLWSQWKSYQRSRQRQEIEDALKTIYHAQLDGITPETEDLAQALGSSQAKVKQLVVRMNDQGLLENGPGLKLTPDGQRWALQVIRAHRLWERYLADEARLPLHQVHSLAHKREHGMTVDEINALDAALGHPASDPHGDPIPSAQGKLRSPHSSLKLVDLETGRLGKIVHLEDEPPIAYAQLLAEGLQVGQEVGLLDSTTTRVILSAGEREITLAPTIADNIFVAPIEEQEAQDKDVIPLSKLKSRETAEVVALDEQCQGFTRRRFLDLGLTPGTDITPELDNAFREPRAYRVRGTLIALRKDQSDMILVRRQNYREQASTVAVNEMAGKP